MPVPPPFCTRCFTRADSLLVCGETFSESSPWSIARLQSETRLQQQIFRR